jgi:hypothetical protein
MLTVLTVHSVGCNKLDVSGRQLKGRQVNFDRNMPRCDSECLTFSVIFKFTFVELEHLCQPLDRVCSCGDLIYSNVVSAPLCVRRPDISPVFYRSADHLKSRIKSVNFH